MRPRRWPVAHEAEYRLDAGDKLRVMVYGQDGLTNTYAIDAGGSITMPLIGAVPARGRTPARLASEIAARLRRGYIRDPSVAVEIESLPAVLHSRRGRCTRPISLCPQHEHRERGGDRRRLFAASPARPGHPDPRRRVRSGPHHRPAQRRRQSRRHHPRRRALVLKCPPMQISRSVSCTL